MAQTMVGSTLVFEIAITGTSTSLTLSVLLSTRFSPARYVEQQESGTDAGENRTNSH
jgi:hypothetical protein